MFKNKTKKITNFFDDMMLNIIATILPVFVLQFALLPIVAQKYDEFSYGLVLTLIGLITLSVQTFSVSLTNSRLLMNHTYEERGIVGDFNILLIIYCFFNIIILSIGTYLYEGNFNIVNIFLIVLISLLQLVRRYLQVSFRLKLNYKSILYSNIILVIGYLIGMLIFLKIGLWQAIYLVGELASLVYVIRKTRLLNEPIKMTDLFKNTSRHALIILVASFLGTANSQIDRLLLYPILGARVVTVYYVSTLFGKTLSMLVAPINNVILTYLSKMKKFDTNSFNLLLVSASILGLISYVIIIILSEPILSLLYPTYVEEAMKLIYITTLTAIVTMLSTVINPVIMKFCNITWQIWTNTVNIIVYLVLAIYLVDLYEVFGFCIAALVAAILKFIVIIIVYYKNQK